MGDLVVVPTVRAWRARVTTAPRAEVDALEGRSRAAASRLQGLADSFTQFATDLEAMQRTCDALARISALCRLAADTGNVELMCLAREIARLRYAALAKEKSARNGVRATRSGEPTRPAG